MAAEHDGDDTPNEPLIEQLRVLEREIRKNFAVEKTLREQLDEAVAEEDYELAARLRDQILAVRREQSASHHARYPQGGGPAPPDFAPDQGGASAKSCRVGQWSAPTRISVGRAADPPCIGVRFRTHRPSLPGSRHRPVPVVVLE